MKYYPHPSCTQFWFTSDVNSGICVEGKYHNEKFTIWKYYPNPSCTHFNFYLDTTTCNDEECSKADANSVCNKSARACECKDGFTANSNNGICVEGMHRNDKICIWNIILFLHVHNSTST